VSRWTFWCKTGRNGAAAKCFVKCLLHRDCRVASNHTTKALQTWGFYHGLGGNST
jgi:hypothetical protein